MHCHNTIQLVALDLDGTLLHTNKSISNYTLKVIQTLSDRGIIIIPTTGRNISGIQDNILKIPSILYAVCSNGASVYDIQTGRLLHQSTIPLDEALTAIEYLQHFPTCIYVQTNQGTFRSSSWKKSGLIKKYPYINFEENNVLDLLNFLKEHPVSIWKIGVFALNEDTFRTLLRKGSPTSTITLLRTGDCNIELNSIHASKGNGLKFLCSKLDISMSQVLAIGDNQNDISMFRLSGVSVAMGNAELDVKSVADYIAGTNDEDSAAVFLEKYLKDTN